MTRDTAGAPRGHDSPCEQVKNPRMHPIRLLVLLLLSFAMLGVVRAAEPGKVHWYEIVIQSGQSVERFIGSSTLLPDELDRSINDEVMIELENLRALENRGDGPRWWATREGETVSSAPAGFCIITSCRRIPKGNAPPPFCRSRVRPLAVSPPISSIGISRTLYSLTSGRQPRSHTARLACSLFAFVLREDLKFGGKPGSFGAVAHCLTTGPRIIKPEPSWPRTGAATSRPLFGFRGRKDRLYSMDPSPTSPPQHGWHAY